MMPPDSTLNAALRQFDATEANLEKATRILKEATPLIPTGLGFCEDEHYDDLRHSLEQIVASLPAIDGWRPRAELMSLTEIGQSRLDAAEMGEPEAFLMVEQSIERPWRELAKYRRLFGDKRRQLVRESLVGIVQDVDSCLARLHQLVSEELAANTKVEATDFASLGAMVDQIDILLGSDPRPPRWADLRRHLHFGLLGDLSDILRHDWPSVRQGILDRMYGENDPLPIDVEDLSDLVASRPTGLVATQLRWDNLGEDDFERLLFTLISFEPSYENPEWLMRTNAPDRGRDLSVWRVHADPLSGTIRARVIIQCKHWLKKSVGPGEVATLKEQMRLWEPPRVDVHVIATSGRFTADAVAAIERHNNSDAAMRIEMWPESHLERLLAHRPAVVAQFGLR